MQEPSNQNMPSFEMSMAKANELIEAIAQFEYKALADILKAQGFQFKSNKKLLHFIQFNLVKTIDSKGKWVRYEVNNPVTKEVNYLFTMHKNIIINEEGGASIKLDIQTTQE